MTRWVSIAEAGRATGKKRQHLQQLLKAGRIPEEYVRISPITGRTQLRLEGLREELEAILRSRTDTRRLAVKEREEVAPWPADRDAAKQQIAATEEGGLPSLALSERRIRALKSALLQIELAERKGQMLPVEEVRRAAEKQARDLRDNLMLLPSRLAHEVAATTDYREVVRLMEAEIRRCLQTLADGGNLAPAPRHGEVMAP